MQAHAHPHIPPILTLFQRLFLYWVLFNEQVARSGGDANRLIFVLVVLILSLSLSLSLPLYFTWRGMHIPLWLSLHTCMHV